MSLWFLVFRLICNLLRIRKYLKAHWPVYFLEQTFKSDFPFLRFSWFSSVFWLLLAVLVLFYSAIFFVRPGGCVPFICTFSFKFRLCSNLLFRSVFYFFDWRELLCFGLFFSRRWVCAVLGLDSSSLVCFISLDSSKPPSFSLQLCLFPPLLFQLFSGSREQQVPVNQPLLSAVFSSVLQQQVWPLFMLFQSFVSRFLGCYYYFLVCWF